MLLVSTIKMFIRLNDHSLTPLEGVKLFSYSLGFRTWSVYYKNWRWKLRHIKELIIKIYHTNESLRLFVYVCILNIPQNEASGSGLVHVTRPRECVLSWCLTNTTIIFQRIFPQNVFCLSTVVYEYKCEGYCKTSRKINLLFIATLTSLWVLFMGKRYK